jgi:hypothetical protein
LPAILILGAEDILLGEPEVAEGALEETEELFPVADPHRVREGVVGSPELLRCCQIIPVPSVKPTVDDGGVFWYRHGVLLFSDPSWPAREHSSSAAHSPDSSAPSTFAAGGYRRGASRGRGRHHRRASRRKRRGGWCIAPRWVGRTPTGRWVRDSWEERWPRFAPEAVEEAKGDSVTRR